MQATVCIGACIHPASENRTDGTPKLFARVLREGTPEFGIDLFLEALDNRLPVIGIHIGIKDIALVFLVDFKDFLEMVMIDAKDHIAIHLNETTVAVIRKTAVTRDRHQTFNRFVIQAEIKNRVHHARHRSTCAGTDRNQQRVFGVAKFAPDQGFDSSKRLFDFGFKTIRVRTVIVIKCRADFGRDGKAGRDRKAEIAHLGKVGTFAAQKLAHIGTSFGATATEAVNPFGHLAFSSSGQGVPEFRATPTLFMTRSSRNRQCHARQCEFAPAA